MFVARLAAVKSNSSIVRALGFETEAVFNSSSVNPF